MNLFLYCFVLVLSVSASSAQNLNREKQTAILQFIEAVKNNDSERVLSGVTYPFNRLYPLPDVKDKPDFLRRYQEIIDDSLRSVIVRSAPTDDWSDMGWRGLMLHNGLVWLDDTGSLMSINNLSDAERTQRNRLIIHEKNALHPSVRDFMSPLHLFETKKFSIRIDEMPDGSLRYASWNVNAPPGDKPSLIIPSGRCTPEGSGGNLRYVFTNGDYTYECSFFAISDANHLTASLSVFHQDKKILSQKAVYIKN